MSPLPWAAAAAALLSYFAVAGAYPPAAAWAGIALVVLQLSVVVLAISRPALRARHPGTVWWATGGTVLPGAALLAASPIPAEVLGAVMIGALALMWRGFALDRRAARDVFQPSEEHRRAR